MIKVKYLVENENDRELILDFLKKKGFQVSEETRERNGKVERLLCVEVEAEQARELIG